LSLGLEVGDKDVMERPPRPADQHVLSLRDCFIITFDSVCMAVMLLVNYYHSYHVRGDELEYARTFAFMLLAMLHLVHSFCARSLTETVFQRDMFSSNPTLGIALIISVTFLVIGCYVPGLNTVLELVPLGGLEWGIIFINLAAHVIIVEARKYALRVHARAHPHADPKHLTHTPMIAAAPQPAAVKAS
jgi:Ca2+-transporting ATPase